MLVNNHVLTLSILMEYPIHIDTIRKKLSILYFKGCLSKFLYNDVFLSLKIVFILANICLFDLIR